MDHPYLTQLLYEQENLANLRAKSYIIDSTGQKRPQRNIYSNLYGYFDDYCESHNNPRWINITGVRGT